MARFYCLTPLERRVAEALVDTARPTVVDQYRFNASQVLTALNGSGAGVSDDEIDDILGRLEAAGIIMQKADEPRIYSLVERDRDFAIKAVLDNGVDIETPRETTTIHRVEAEVLRTILEHEHLDAASLKRVVAPLEASGADGVRPISAFTKWVTTHFLINQSVGDEIGAFSRYFPPFWFTSAPWVVRLGVRDAGVTVDRLFRLEPDDIAILFPVVSEMRSSDNGLNVWAWCKEHYDPDDWRRQYAFLNSTLRFMFNAGQYWCPWRLSPEFGRQRFVVMEPFGARFRSRGEDLSDSYMAHPDHAYWQLAVLAGKATVEEAERDMGTPEAHATKDATPPSSPADEPPSAPPEPAPAPEPPSPVFTVSDAVSEDAEASRERVLNRKRESDHLDHAWRQTCENHDAAIVALRAEVEQLRADLARKEYELGRIVASPPVPDTNRDLRREEFDDAVRRHNAAYGDVLFLDETGAHVVPVAPQAAAPAKEASHPPPKADAPLAQAGKADKPPAPRAGNGITEWNDAAKGVLRERVLAAGLDKRAGVVDAFIAEHPAFAPMNVRAVVSRMAGNFRDTFCKSYTEGRTGRDRTKAIHRLATFYGMAPKAITEIVCNAR